MAKTNCWEHKKCGREVGGAKVKELGVCPVSTSATNSGKNGGNAAGRFCWKVAGSFCGGKVQGTWAEKMMDYVDCDFFKSVRSEEGAAFQA